MGLSGTGIGLRGVLFHDYDFQVDYAFALAGTSYTPTNSSRVNFKIRYQF